MSKYTTEIFIQKIDVKKVIVRLLQFYKYYIVLVFICLVGAYYYNSTAPSVYKNSATILVKDEDNSQSLLSSRDFLSNLGYLNNPFSIETKIELLRSFRLINETIKKLNFEVSYFKNRSAAPMGLFQGSGFMVVSDELYSNSPIKVVFNHAYSQPVYYEFKVKILSNDKYILEVTGDVSPKYNYIDDNISEYAGPVNYKKAHRFNEEVVNDNFRFTVTLNKEFDQSMVNSEVLFNFNNIDFLTYNFINSLSVEQTSQLSSLLRISVYGQNFEKVTDFTNQLLFTLLNTNLEKKNEIASSTINFIDSQISTISDSLSTAESNLRNFRSANQVTDLSYQGQKIFEQMSTIENDKAALMVQRRYYENLQNYINSSSANTSAPVAPSTMSFADPVLSDLIRQLTGLNSQLNETGQGDKNIFRAEVEKQAASLKQTIRENINSNLRDVKTSINEVDYRLNGFKGEISKLPGTELRLLGIQRTFNLNNQIYTFLLQKRFEAEIAKSSNAPDYEIVDTPTKFKTNPVSPKKKMNYLVALLLGLIVPTCVILLKDLFNNKITEEEQLEQLDLVFLGHIIANSGNENQVVLSDPNSPISESFRNIQSSLSFLLDDPAKKVITLTSSISGEGKSFCTLNLASTFALNGAKVIILEFDLRRPTIHKYLNIEPLVGLSGYLSNQALIMDVIMETSQPNLHFLPAGRIAPNPAQLIASQKTRDLIDYLRDEYDYIFIDTAPVGIISESFNLLRLSDFGIVIVKANYTVKQALLNTLKSFKNNGILNVGTLLNGINVVKSTYKYKYTSNYYSNHGKKKGLRKKSHRKGTLNGKV